MTAVPVELAPMRGSEDADTVELIEDVDAYTADHGTVPGCNDDNPYR